MTRLANKGSALSKLGLALALFGGLMLGGTVVAQAQTGSPFSSEDFLVNYFVVGTGGSDDVLTLVNGDAEVPQENINPNQTSPDDFVSICANVYVFDREEELTGCCETEITAGGKTNLPINELTAGLHVDGHDAPETGEIKVVATNGATSVAFLPSAVVIGGLTPVAIPLPCDAQAPGDEAFLAGFEDGTLSFISASGATASTEGTEFALHGWITHTHSATIGTGGAANFVTELPLADADEGNDDFADLAGNCVFHAGNCCTIPGVVGAGGSCD